ncbi:glycosyltransferase [Salinimicrobium sp. TH3]|uniref:glycosyltransferase n=1 Tax=Salinimicrobium sp. TH3 TaxID=2997342 RepID=UPI0022732AB2|nr:glycosyltransferase [Salinimicrobium sp. TH3]MCY2686976.1 glycosyltransferase [Salinimicrobium sp. TH3]
MKVLYLIDSLEGYGAEKSLVHIALNMTTVTPVFVHIYKGEKLKATLEEKGIKVYSLNLDHLYGFKKAVELLSQILIKENPEILHSTLFRAEIVGRLMKKKFPNVILVGSFVSNSYGKLRYSQLSFLARIKLFSIQQIDRATAGRVDYFICNSKTIKISNIKALGIPEDKVHVIYRGRSFEGSKNSNKYIYPFLNEIKNENKKIFLNVGRLAKGKGQLDLLKAFHMLNQRKSGNILVVAGDGPLREELSQTIKEMKLEEDVYLIGYTEEVPELFSMVDFFVFPSYFEGLPGALIEATIYNTPSIVSDIMENKECLPADGALFFQPGNINQLSEKMEEALYIENWEPRVKKAFEYAQENFRIECISKEYEIFYTQIKSKFKK